MSRFRFIHAADIHLGSMLHIDGAEEGMLADHCRKAVYKAFERLCQKAVEYQVKFILISGDLYDRESRNVYANRLFADMCRKLDEKGIGVFVAAGNHDPLMESQELFALTPNVHICKAGSPSVFEVTDDGRVIARVIGQSYNAPGVRDRIYREFNLPGDGIFNIAMLHTQLEASGNYIPSTVSDLMNVPNIHYWALGHIHKPGILNKRKPVIAYSGTPQGRDFGEEGPGGCFLVEVDGTEITGMKRIITSSVMFRTINIDISSDELKNAEDLTTLEAYIVDKANQVALGLTGTAAVEPPADADAYLSKVYEGLNEPDDFMAIEGCAVRWLLSGRGNLHRVLRNLDDGGVADITQALRSKLESLRPFIWTDSVVIRTSSPLTDQTLAEHATLRKLLEQSVGELFSDESKARQLKSGLGLVWQGSGDHEARVEDRFFLDDDTFRSVIEDACQLILEKISEKAGD